jgi:hypothetical protein
VEIQTSTMPRSRRLDEILANLPPGATVQDAVAVLRDKKGIGDEKLPLGDRRTLDALIATHGVVLDATAKVLWVSEGPHLVGRFLAFDLGALFHSAYSPAAAPDPAVIPPDPIAESGEYDAWQRAGSPHHGAN